MKVLQVLAIVAQGLLVVAFASHSETAGKVYLWTFAAWAAIMAVALVLVVPVRLYGWLRDRNK